ncbi:transposase [Cupriavidus sp. WS]|uniref:transposase n=1 Tax=Cupriavidus sp. WS TaxID=1312922 RepID=UPI001E56B40B|nr:transposase [Cupriavidus sp. WS]
MSKTKSSTFGPDAFGYMPTPALHLGSIVRDIPPIVGLLGTATCHTPAELLACRARFGNPTYAIADSDDGVTWYFSNDLMEAIAIGLKWVEKDCALVQIPEDQDGEAVYAYIVRGLEDDRTFGQRLYDQKFWRRAGGDLNEPATPEILTRVRIELFKFMARWGSPFLLLDFSEPASVAMYLQDWKDELEL